MLRALSFVCGLVGGVAALGATDRALAPDEALKSFRLEPGLRIELVAAEPTVVAPVAMAFDEHGRMFVAENRGYPTNANPAQGVIALLEDADGNGSFEKRTVFADGLTFPNGVMPWKGGVIVTCAPDVLFLQDTNHDGRADTREVLFTGFDASNTTQLRVSHPTLGLDNWIYVTSGLVSGKVKRPGETNAIDLRTDFRFRPDLSAWEAAEGRGQFGLTFDDFGRRFICMNRLHVQHVVLPARYLRRNPLLSTVEPVQDCPESLEPEPLPGHKPAARIYPISDNVTTADSHAGTFTAACGVTVYRGTGLPYEFHGNVFTCDPAANLVHRDRLVPSGSTFIARANATTNEFLASTDNWFRPVFLANAPDGALYVCDMYRRSIEHPQYLPEEVRKRTDFESGRDKGRIYRVTAMARTKRRPRFRTWNTQTAVMQLNNPEGWWRDTAHRLLTEKQDKAAIFELRDLATNAPLPQTRVHALNLLEPLNGLSYPLLVAALGDKHAGVRENAVRVSESRLPGEILESVLALADDPDPRVRLQCAASLGETLRKQATSALVTIALRDANDRWTRMAVLSSIRDGQPFFHDFVEQARERADGGTAELMRELGRLLGSTVGSNTPPPVVWRAITNALATDLIVPFFAGWKEQNTADVIADNAVIFDRAATLASNATRELEWRVAAAQALGFAPLTTAEAPLLACMAASQSPALQTAAARAFARLKEPEAAAALLKADRWKSFSPAGRGSLIASLLSERRHWPALLAAIENKAVPESALTRSQRKQLLESKDPAVRKRAQKLFELGAGGDRMKVFEDYKSVLSLKPDPANGRAVFKQHCSACHRLDREGVPVGPDLFGIRNQDREAILLHTIVPEYEIMPGYAAYRLKLKDGRELEGMIASESPTHIRLRRALGEEESIAREQIVSMESSGLSLMPQELEKNMTRQDMADLVAYLKGM
jgi:putative membrane-bound dehydrogenase-like protein